MYFKGAALMYGYKRGVLDQSKEMVARLTEQPSEQKGHRQCWSQEHLVLLPSEAEESVVFLQLWKLVPPEIAEHVEHFVYGDVISSWHYITTYYKHNQFAVINEVISNFSTYDFTKSMKFADFHMNLRKYMNEVNRPKSRGVMITDEWYCHVLLFRCRKWST